MSAPVLAIKLYAPPLRPNVVQRARLITRLNENHQLSLISAPAGFGKTTLVSEWINQKAEGGRMNQAHLFFILHLSALILPKSPGCR
jgi:ATP/maltotriose-dependent transcriptional regulator MalT